MISLGTHTDANGHNLLHLAAQAVVEGEATFFLTLLKLRFPLYGEDAQLNFAAFTICEAADDNLFSKCLNALMACKFDVNRPNDDDESFLQHLCTSEKVN